MKVEGLKVGDIVRVVSKEDANFGSTAVCMSIGRSTAKLKFSRCCTAFKVNPISDTIEPAMIVPCYHSYYFSQFEVVSGKVLKIV